jgi:tRNA pseudouridine55 synthase
VNRAEADINGVIVINKPPGWTSHDVVARTRGIAGTRRVGHLGTLDPIATGVLPLMIGQATRLARFWDGSEKGYKAVIRFGFATSTYDRAGEPCGPDTRPDISADRLETFLAPMRGEIEQTPPPVSAKKINGVPAYKLTRKNIHVDLAPVKISIYELTLLAVESPCARLYVRCSAGTYIRSIAHELGILLGCGAHVDALERTQSGPFCLERAFSLEQLQKLKDDGRLQEALISMTDLLPEMPGVVVDDATATQIRQGRDFSVSPFSVEPRSLHVKAMGTDGTLLAIGRIAMPHLYHPIVVLGA